MPRLSINVLVVFFRYVRRKQKLKVLAFVLLWFLTFQLLVVMWLREEKKDIAGQSRKNWEIIKTTSHLTTSSNQLEAKNTPTQNPNFNVTVKESQAGKTLSSLKESQFIVVDSVSKLAKASETEYVLIIPHKVHNIDLGFNVLERKDQLNVEFLGNMLNSLDELDGATCIARSHFSPLFDELDIPWRRIFNSSWCNFARRDWSIQIRNTGTVKALNTVMSKNPGLFTNISIPNVFQMCNIVDGPLILRKSKFVEIGDLNSDFGRLSMLDFFLRSNGKLKIGKFGNCILSEGLFHTDRAALEGTGDFPEYSDFGMRHGILRIIKEDRIEWTMCAASGKLCKEKPYVPPSTLPQVGQPVCCSVVLGKMLKDVVDVFVKLGVKHFVVYGTLLGAIRNKAIIPWSHDVDISLEEKHANNYTFFAIVQQYLKDRYYVGKSFMGMSRGIPLMPAHIKIKTTPFFDGDDDLEGDKFFSPAIRESVEEFLPVLTGSDWRSRGYMDFYAAADIWWNGSSIITIDGNSYISIKEIDYELENWYGKNYMTPVLHGEWRGLSDAGAVEG